MASIRRVPVSWQTGAGGSGVSIFYSASADDATAALGAFFTAVKALFPTAVSWQVPSSGDLVDNGTGILTGSWSGGTAATITATGVGNYAAGTGTYVRWYTNTIRVGRKFIGRTFLAPLVVGCYDTDGTITAGNLTTFQTAVNTLVATNKLVLWGRPLDTPPTNGISAPITSGLMVDRVTSLKSRRS